MPKRVRWIVGLVAVSAAALLGGCLSGGDSVPEPLPGSGGIDPKDVYPEGPYGTTIGSVIRNYEFEGYARPGQGLGVPWRSKVELADFYNPSGTGVYGATSMFEPGKPLPRALVVNMSAGWCPPCKHEAKNVLPGKYDSYKPQGAEIMLVLSESGTQSHVATFLDLDNWVGSFASEFPSVLDPSQQMSVLFDASAYPANLIIDTRDMTIVEMVQGLPQAGFWAKLEGLLAEEP